MAQESTSFETKIHVRFGDADPAGIMYFPRIFDFAHQVFEEFIDATGIGWKNWFRAGPYIVPLRHVNGEFLKPLLPGRAYRARGWVSKLGASSFEMSYEFLSEGGEPAVHARVQMVHVFADAASKTKIPVPVEIRGSLEKFFVRETETT